MSRFPLPPAEPLASEHWSGPEFEAELRTWVEEAVGPVRLEQFKLRGWATVLKVYAEEGLLWAKQSCALNLFEAALVDEIGRVTPDRVVPLRAVDRQRGLLLMPDEGDVFGIEHADLESWCEVVQQWAQLQRELLPYGDRLAAAGVATLRPQDSEELAAERTRALNALPVDDPRRLPDEDAERVTAGIPELRRSVEAVAAVGLPMALNHNDLHGGNVFAVSGAAMRSFDLGDALLTEPMAVLLTPLGILVDRFSCAPDDPRLWQVAEAMVEVWSDLAPAPQIRAALPHALRLARLARHEAWLRATPPMSLAELADWGSAATYWLAALPRRPLLAGD
ncbi:MAG: hypothetical protein ABI873_13990 [Marmoricola sp.]